MNNRGAVNTSQKAHWENVYATKESVSVSWYQPVPKKSLELIRSTDVAMQAPILDVGGGASTLVDNLLDAGFQDVSVLDIASSTFKQAHARMGATANLVTWIEADVTEFKPSRTYAVWHDRAVFHFLTDTADRDKYLDVLRQALQPRGRLLLATFGEEGPTRCSGLEVQRYSIAMLKTLLEPEYRLCLYEIGEHRTPKGSPQEFLYSSWQAK
jgi:SAM-dependent methyltransferase